MINRQFLDKATQACIPKIRNMLNSTEGFEDSPIGLKEDIQVRLFMHYFNKIDFSENERGDGVLENILLELDDTDSFEILLSQILYEIFINPRDFKFYPTDITSSFFWRFHRAVFEKKLSLFLINSSLAEKKTAILKFYNDNPSIKEKTKTAINKHLKYEERNFRNSEIKSKVWIFLFDQLAVALYRESLESNKEAWQADFLTLLVFKRMQRESDYSNSRWNLNNKLALKLERIWGADYERVIRPFRNRFSNKNAYKLDSAYNPFDHEPLNKSLKGIQSHIKSGKNLEIYLGFFLLKADEPSFYYDKPVRSKTISIENLPSKDREAIIRFSDNDRVTDIDPKEKIRKYIPLFFKAFFQLQPIYKLVMLSVADNEKYIKIMRSFDPIFNSYATQFSKLYKKDEENMEDIYAIKLITKEKPFEKRKDSAPDKIRTWYKENIYRKGAKRSFDLKLKIVMDEFKKTSSNSKSQYNGR